MYSCFPTSSNAASDFTIDPCIGWDTPFVDHSVICCSLCEPGIGIRRLILEGNWIRYKKRIRCSLWRKKMCSCPLYPEMPGKTSAVIIFYPPADIYYNRSPPGFEHIWLLLTSAFIFDPSCLITFASQRPTFRCRSSRESGILSLRRCHWCSMLSRRIPASFPLLPSGTQRGVYRLRE